MPIEMVNFDSVARAGRAALGLISWRAMPLVVRVLFAVLFSFVVLVTIYVGSSWLEFIDPVYEVIYLSLIHI